MLPEEVLSQVKEEFKDLQNTVKLIVFTQEIECQYCNENHKLAEEVANVSDKILLEVYNFSIDKEKVEQHGIEQIPAIVISSDDKDYGIKFYGIPGGYEFKSLIGAIKMVSKGESGLTSASKEQLKKINVPVQIKVLITLSCPYCSNAVEMAHKIAMENDNIQGEMIEIQEFPHLSSKYDVYAVPRVIINETVQFEGALPEKDFVNYILSAVKEDKSNKN